MRTVLGPGFPRGPPEDPPEDPPQRVGGINQNYVVYHNEKFGTIVNFTKKKRVWAQFWGLDTSEDPPEDLPQTVGGTNQNDVFYQNKEGGTIANFQKKGLGTILGPGFS